MRLRPATVDDAELLTRWDEDPAVSGARNLEPGDPARLEEWRVELSTPIAHLEQLIVELDGRAIGYVQVCDPRLEATHYWGDVEPNLRAVDLWLGEARDRNRGLGTRVMQLVIERCFAEPQVRAIIIDPLVENAAALRFWERLGFRFVERRWFDDDECAVMRLERP